MNSMDLGLLRAHGFVVLTRVLDAVKELPGRPWWLRRIALMEPYGGPELKKTLSAATLANVAHVLVELVPF